MVVTRHESRLTLDVVMMESDEPSLWPTPGTPFAMQLGLPDVAWMGDALATLLEEWTDDDSVAAVVLVTTSKRTIARLIRGDAVVSLPLLEPLAA